MIRGRLRHNSILWKLMLPIVLVVALQALLYPGVLLLSGALGSITNNSYDGFNEKTINFRNYFENEMIHRWSNLSETEQDVLAVAERVLDGRGQSFEDVAQDYTLNAEILSECAESLLYLLRKNSVTGAFLVLDGPGTENQEEPYFKAGLYIRNPDPATSSPTNEDLEFIRGNRSICEQLGLKRSNDRATFAFSEDGSLQREQFFFKPLGAARENDNKDSKNYGYWSPGFRLTALDEYITTYSIPLIVTDRNSRDYGKVLGVVGVELSDTYLRKQFETNGAQVKGSNAFLLCRVEQSGDSLELHRVSGTGSLGNRFFGTVDAAVSVTETDYPSISRFVRDDSVYASVQYLNLYSASSAFKEQWAVVGMEEADSLLAFPRTMKRTVLSATLVALALGVLGAALASSRISKPIARLSAEVRDYQPAQGEGLRRINIAEIDELADSFLKMSRDAEATASKMSEIISASKILIGVFEHKNSEKQVFLSRTTYRVLGWKQEYEGNYMPSAEFYERLSAVMESKVETGSDAIVCKLHRDGETAWVQIVYTEDEERMVGVAIDMTKEMQDKERIEYERDYDVLTGLYNRRSFNKYLLELFQEPEKLKVACMLMWDLDNLKYINDNYGHDYGDRYIQLLARTLKGFLSSKALVSRISGDEFQVFLYGYDSKEEIRAIVSREWAEILEAEFQLPDAENFKLRVSVGMAWYPDDAESAELLQRYADFAMYSVKHSQKGRMQEFDRAGYQDNSILVEGQEELNRFLDKSLVRYAFQPIVDASTGKVFAYEALMRPQTETLKSPEDVLRVAKQQAKLYRVERLTWFEAMKAFAEHCRSGRFDPSVKVFINSISNCVMTKQDIREFEERYEEYLPRVVLEVMENEPVAGGGSVYTKLNVISKWNAMVAIDDFGTGYNGESALLFVTPNFVKIDKEIVRGIDRDENRYRMLNNLLNYFKERKISVIAEGVETAGEMATLIASGVDYLQGFYLGKPGFEPEPLDPAVVREIRKFGRKPGARP